MGRERYPIKNISDTARWMAFYRAMESERLDAHFLHRDLGRRVADIGPPRRVEPDTRVGPLHEQDLVLLVPDDRGNADLRGDVAGHSFTDLSEPLLDLVLGVVVAAGGVRDVRGHGQDLFEPLAFVQALCEPEASTGDARQRFAPTDEVLPRRLTFAVGHLRDDTAVSTASRMADSSSSSVTLAPCASRT